LRSKIDLPAIDNPMMSRVVRHCAPFLGFGRPCCRRKLRGMAFPTQFFAAGHSRFARTPGEQRIEIFQLSAFARVRA
jgi:hypothetical protein